MRWTAPQSVRSRLYRTIRAQGRVELLLSLAAIAANSSLLALADRPGQRLIATLALACSLALVGANLLKLSVLSPIPRLEIYRRMGSSIRRARELLVELALCRHSMDAARIDDVVQRANVVAAELNAESEADGVPARSASSASTHGVLGHAVVRDLIASLFANHGDRKRPVKPW